MLQRPSGLPLSQELGHGAREPEHGGAMRCSVHLGAETADGDEKQDRFYKLPYGAPLSRVDADSG